LDAQYQIDEAGTFADSTIAARCNDRDFGTSRYPSSFGQNTPPPEAEKGVEKHTTDGMACDFQAES
jgi:hypothetical protein